MAVLIIFGLLFFVCFAFCKSSKKGDEYNKLILKRGKIMKKFGLDISEYQSNEKKIDFKKVKSSGVQFLIIRSSYGRTHYDKYFFEHVKGAQDADIPIIGVYHFMYALNNQHAKINAEKAIEAVQKAGLPKSTVIWADVEYDTIRYAKDNGVSLGKNEIDLFTRTFCESIKAAGYPTGIYLNNDYRKNYYYPATLEKYDLWLADYTGDPDVPCAIQQYTNKVKINGIKDPCDGDYLFVADSAQSQPTTASSALKKGSKGTAVKAMQEKLIYCSFSCGPTGADADFGKNTETAISLFQSTMGMAPTGIYDENTKKALSNFYNIVKIYRERAGK